MGIEEKFKIFGLNKYEARAYLTLVKEGVSSAKEISKFSGVPYSRIYDVLDSLEKKGWILVESGKPLRYKARDPKNILTSIEIKIKKEISEAKKFLLRELSPYLEKSLKKVGVWIIRDKKRILDKVRDMIDGSKESLHLLIPYIPEEFIGEIPPLYELLLKKRDEGIEVKVILGRKVNIKRKLDIKFYDERTGWMIIKDGEEIFYASPFIEGGEIGLWTNEHELVRMGMIMFQHMWRSI